MDVIYLSLQEYVQGTAGYTHVHEIVTGLRNLGTSIELIVPQYRRPTRSVIKRAFVMIILQLRLAVRMILGRKPDVLYIRHHYAALPITIIVRLLGIPMVVEVNGPVDDFIISWSIPSILVPIVKLMAYWQCRLGTWLIGVTPGLAHLLAMEYGVPPERISVILNGVNTEVFRRIPLPDLSSWPQLTDIEYVIFVGALSAWQGIDTMLQAIESKEWPEGVALLVAGDGTERRKVEIKQSSRLIFLGRVPYNQVPQLMNRSIAGLCLKSPSHTETGLSPLKLYEYAACGRPVIVTDLPGLNDFVVATGCGIVIPCDDPAALCTAVRELLEDPEKREAMGKVGAELVRESFSWELRAKETLEILIRVAN